MNKNPRPTAEQFEQAMELAEREGIGIERAMLAVQSPAIAETQQFQWLRTNAPALVEAMRTFAETMDRIIRDMVESPAWPAMMALVESVEKDKRRRERHARWQARKRSR